MNDSDAGSQQPPLVSFGMTATMGVVTLYIINEVGYAAAGVALLFAIFAEVRHG